MNSSISVRLDPEMERLLEDLCEATGRSRSDIIREALRRQLRVLRFEELRKQVMHSAEAHGYLTDEDVFQNVS